MNLKWYGHACFSMKFENGTTLVLDPFDDAVGYPLCRARADAALLSHSHHDHNHVVSLCGNPQIIRDGAPCELNGLKIHGVDSFHDEVQGEKRGHNIMFVIEGDGLRIAHLGDLGHLPSAEQYAALGKLDLMLIPIGGTYTITSTEASEIIRAAKPRMAIAMHYKTVLCGLPITDEQEFVRLMGAKYIPNEISITPESLETLPESAVMLCPSAR